MKDFNLIMKTYFKVQEELEFMKRDLFHNIEESVINKRVRFLANLNSTEYTYGYIRSIELYEHMEGYYISVEPEREDNYSYVPYALDFEDIEFVNE